MIAVPEELLIQVMNYLMTRPGQETYLLIKELELKAMKMVDTPVSKEA